MPSTSRAAYARRKPFCSARAAAEPALTIPVVPPTKTPLMITRSKVCWPKRPSHAHGPHDDEVDELVEVPLVDEEPVQEREALADALARPGLQDPDPVGDVDAGRAPSTVPSTRPKAVSASLGSRCRLESANVGSRNFSTSVSTHGTCSSPPRVASKARAPIATFIGTARSAMWCSGPGKPTSVSSISPLLGLKGASAWWMWPSSSSRASGHGSPQKARKIIRHV